MKKMSFFLILLLIGISQVKLKLQKEKNEKIDITIISLELPNPSCIPELSSYIYHIKVEFSKSPDITKPLSIDLSSNIKSLCYPFEKTSVSDSFLQCQINTVDYPIKNKNLYLPIKAPYFDDYNFIKWEEIIGKNPEVSNKISEKEIYCVPQELNSFKINEIKNEGCSNNNNIISIKGQWKDEKIIIPKNFELNLDKIKGKCNLISFNWIQCEIEGKGKINFSDGYYFKYGINNFLLEKNEKSIDINNCLNSCSYIFYQKLFLYFIILLLV